MPSTTLVISHQTELDMGSLTLRDRRTLLRRVINALQSAAGGSKRIQSIDVIANAREEPVAASGFLTLATSSGAVGATINGATVTATWATSDIISAGLIAAAINASTNAAVQYKVRASNLSATATLAAVVAGTTFDVCGYRLTATATATGRPGDFDISGTNDQDAAALGAAINALPGLNEKVRAYVSTNVVTIFGIAATAPTSNYLLTSATTITLSGKLLIASLKVLVTALPRTRVGNDFTLVASGTNVSANAANLAGGKGGNGAITTITI